MQYLVSVVFWLVFVLTSPLGFLLGLLIWLGTAPFDPQRHALHAFITRWTFTYLRLFPGWDVRVEGREHLPKGPCVYVANHQSMADVVAVMGLATPFKYVSKASLFSLPLVGWMMHLAQYVRLERGNTRSTQRMMDSCRQWLRRGVPVLIFPEGTYSDGSRLLPFKRGAFVLAAEEQVPLVPVVIEGTTGLILGDGPWLSPRCRIRVRVQPPVRVEGEPEAFGRTLREQYARWLGIGG